MYIILLYSFQQTLSSGSAGYPEGYVRFALTLPVEKITEAVQAVKNSGLIE